MILTKASFDILRKEIFKKLTASQVEGLNFIVAGCKKAGFTYPECAYALATAYIETAATMQPITEYGSRKYFDKYDTGKLAAALGNTPELDGDGFLYRGRGYVQITGLANYTKVLKLLKIDAVTNPDIVLDKDVAIQILTRGMLDGWFTGRGFRKTAPKPTPVSRYNKEQYRAARRIINGQDRALVIANLAMIFERALRS